MMNGLQLLDSVDQRLRQAEAQAGAAQQELDWLIARRDHVRAEEAAALRALARIRLQALHRLGGPQGAAAELQRLDEADAQARTLLDQRQSLIATAEADMRAKQPALAAAEQARDRCAAALHAADADAERALEQAREAVLADPVWRAKRDAAEAAARVAEHADQKAAFALQDSEVKGGPYLADPLFAYLWRRGFGTAQYRSGFLVRWIDRWVARVARFDAARRDYTMLTDLPRQLADHAVRMRAVAEAEAASVSDHARQLAGLPAAQEMATLRQALEAAEEALQTERAAMEQVRHRLTASTAGDDALTQAAMAALETALGQSSLHALRAAAARTPTPEDDAIVVTLEQAGAVRAETEQMLAQRQVSVAAAQRQVQELRQVRQEMRQGGYGQSRWNFGDSAMVGLLLGELLGGTVSRGGFWGQLNQRRVPDPWNQDGRGGAQPAGGKRQGPWNRPPMHDPWGQLGGGPSGGPSGGSGGGFGGGGFRSGGRMGGGGFKTGGSF